MTIDLEREKSFPRAKAAPSNLTTEIDDSERHKVNQRGHEIEERRDTNFTIYSSHEGNARAPYNTW